MSDKIYVPRKEWEDKSLKLGSMYQEDLKNRRFFVVHHSYPITSTDHRLCPSKVRQIERYHVQTNGWSAIGYNDVLCPHGVHYEGRGFKNVGAHCPGYNRNGLGIALMVDGNRAVSMDVLARLVDIWKLYSYVAGRRLRPLGHRDGKSTNCPGNALYKWVDSWFKGAEV